MTIARRPFVLAGVAAAVIPRTAFAWPDRTLRLIVGFQAGGSTDLIARLLAERLRGPLGGVTIIVENKPGAAGGLAADAALTARDGHTLLMMSDSFVTNSLTDARRSDLPSHLSRCCLNRRVYPIARPNAHRLSI